MWLHAGMVAPSPLSSLQAAGLEPTELPLPAVNLSNRLNPNNVHFDTALAARYKRMGKAEKEALWAADRLQQQQASLSNLDMLGIHPEHPGGSLESQLSRLRQELLVAQQQVIIAIHSMTVLHTFSCIALPQDLHLLPFLKPYMHRRSLGSIQHRMDQHDVQTTFGPDAHRRWLGFPRILRCDALGSLPLAMI